MTETPPNLPPPDWYPDPQAIGQQRWWSGDAWTEHFRPVPQPTPPVMQPEPAPPAYPAPVSQRSQTMRRGFLDSPFEPVGTPRNVPGTLSLVFALLPFAISWLIPGIGLLLAFLFGVTAVVLGIIGIARAGRRGARRGTAIAGLVIGAISLVASVAMMIGAFNASSARITLSDLETQIASSVLNQTGEVVTVQCPSNASFRAGSYFFCTASGDGIVSRDIWVDVISDNGLVNWRFME